MYLLDWSLIAHGSYLDILKPHLFNYNQIDQFGQHDLIDIKFGNWPHHGTP